MTPAEAVQRLKIEVFTPDWCLSRRRIALLYEVFEVLGPEHQRRKGITYILKMARGTLDYISRHEQDFYPPALDFLKEALAHLLKASEDTSFNAAEEARIFTGVYERFMALKRRVGHAGKGRSKTEQDSSIRLNRSGNDDEIDGEI